MRRAASWLAALDLADQFGFPVHGARAAYGCAGLLEQVGAVEEDCQLLHDWYGRCTEGLDTPVRTAVRKRMEKFPLI